MFSPVIFEYKVRYEWLTEWLRLLDNVLPHCNRGPSESDILKFAFLLCTWSIIALTGVNDSFLLTARMDIWDRLREGPGLPGALHRESIHT